MKFLTYLISGPYLESKKWTALPAERVAYHEGRGVVTTRNVRGVFRGDTDAIFSLYANVTLPDDAHQLSVRFVRYLDDGTIDETGIDDRAVTPGRQFVSHMWWFTARPDFQVGVELWHDGTGQGTVNLAYLKGIAL